MRATEIFYQLMLAAAVDSFDGARDQHGRVPEVPTGTNWVESSLAHDLQDLSTTRGEIGQGTDEM